MNNISHKKEPVTKEITVVYEDQVTKGRVTVLLHLSQAEITHCLLFGPARFIKPLTHEVKMSNASEKDRKVAHAMILFIFFSYIAVVFLVIALKMGFKEILIQQYGDLYLIIEFGVGGCFLFGFIPFCGAAAYIFCNGFLYKKSVCHK